MKPGLTPARQARAYQDAPDGVLLSESTPQYSHPPAANRADRSAQSSCCAPAPAAGVAQVLCMVLGGSLWVCLSRHRPYHPSPPDKSHTPVVPLAFPAQPALRAAPHSGLAATSAVAVVSHW